MRVEKRLLLDVPLSFRPEAAGRPEADPSALEFQAKRRIFDNLAKQLEPPTVLQEAQVRHELDRSLGRAVSIH